MDHRHREKSLWVAHQAPLPSARKFGGSYISLPVSVCRVDFIPPEGGEGSVCVFCVTIGRIATFNTTHAKMKAHTAHSTPRKGELPFCSSSLCFLPAPCLLSISATLLHDCPTPYVHLSFPSVSYLSPLLYPYMPLLTLSPHTPSCTSSLSFLHTFP